MAGGGQGLGLQSLPVTVSIQIDTIRARGVADQGWGGALAAHAIKALTAIDAARAAIRARVWSLAGEHAPNHTASVGDPTVVDLGATLLTAHSDKEQRLPRSSAGSRSTRCSRSWTTASTAPASRWHDCCARTTPVPTPPPITRPGFNGSSSLSVVRS